MATSKNVSGRPTDYSEEKLKKAQDYLEKCIADKSSMPSVSELAVVLGVNRETIVSWADDEDKKEFSNTYKRVKALQEQDIISKGLKGKYNPSMSIFLLKANHNMIETEKKLLTGDKANPIAFEFVDGDSQD